ncbi:methyltransferase domain-containing protein [Planctomonas sp. JC2975]|uniref:class I SAM-dependent methyltransferase n=1 Tax=Planctomonas sp. JC2975 TaxID=2729626 RepID=UPI00147312E2|nr:class I SAM-dependent methyltransferase [Planctomonas sp. JC2975]NNC13381.1 methyltransferase domain-containing protein [Planctomonas sp. JC2975]
MVTLPERSVASESHRARQMAESFGANAEAYDRARPRYPDALVDRIIAETRHDTPRMDVLDVGIGTGISAIPFHERGADVLGVDVDDRMATLARSRGFTVEVAKFEKWNAAGRRFDLVIAGQTWHWIDPVAGARKAAEVLRPGGRLALFWNVMRFPEPIGAAFGEVFARVLPGNPIAAGMTAGAGAYGSQLDKAADGIRGAGGFTDIEQWRFDWKRVYSRDEWIDALPTSGGLNRLAAEQLRPLLEGMSTVIDDAGGSFTMDYAAVLATTTRRH